MIREADTDDLDEVYTLWRELLDFHQSHHVIFKYKPGSDRVLKEEIRNRLKDKDTRVFAYVNEQEEWLGLIVATYKKAVEGFKLSRKGYIGETIVKENFRSSGVGKELFEAAKKWLEDKGADHLELQVSVKNTAGLRFWESQGFTPSTYHMVLSL
ncbi:GNAT family N-acetyltransferase [Pontibacter vulgaris]|uniref:GNAT family N-acetyltransferase n=1 Tax=Pontibacter vulgaris TaxID=2905679 RepID=UPI001FA7475D|nr:GNAT family N-acetyltransferase [Pontibacter vulgaris]